MEIVFLHIIIILIIQHLFTELFHLLKQLHILIYDNHFQQLILIFNQYHLIINNILGILRACQRGVGIAMLPDYLVDGDGGLVQLFGDADPIALDAYFVYPEELKTVARVQAFRDFLVANAQRWNY